MKQVTACRKSVDAEGIMRQAFDSGQPFDLVILDMYMPELDGIEVAKRAKKIRPEQIVVLWSAGQMGICQSHLR